MPGKRGNSEGTIRKRSDGRWESRLVLPDGERKSLYGKTRQEAMQRLDRERLRREQGLASLNERQTVADYLREWMEAKRHRVRQGTAIRYQAEVRLRLIPGLGNIPLTKLSPQHLQSFYARLLSAGTSPGMVAYCHHVLYTALEEAMRFGLVPRNVADLVDPPRKSRRELAVYDEDQARKLIAAASGDRFEALCILVLATGMRQGGLLALRWSEVNLDKSTLTVRATLQQYPGQRPSREETKTTHSERMIALPQTAVKALTQHYKLQQKEQARLGAAWNACDLVFPNTIGNPVHASSFRSRWWRVLVRKAVLPYIRFHDLRHTAATLLLGRGVPVKVVSEMLGHANVSITLNMYGHVLPHMQQQAAQTMDAILSGDEPLGSNEGSNLLSNEEHG